MFEARIWSPMVGRVRLAARAGAWFFVGAGATLCVVFIVVLGVAVVTSRSTHHPITALGDFPLAVIAVLVLVAAVAAVPTAFLHLALSSTVSGAKSSRFVTPWGVLSGILFAVVSFLLLETVAIGPLETVESSPLQWFVASVLVPLLSAPFVLLFVRRKAGHDA